MQYNQTLFSNRRTYDANGILSTYVRTIKTYPNNHSLIKYLFAIGFFFINIIGLKAQSDFRDGYIISNNNDTIQALIDYRGNKANARKCNYKLNTDSEILSFSPNEIKGYRFTNSKYYVTKTIDKENEPKQMFLEYLLNGIVDIYYYRDNSGEHYLIDNGNGKLLELKNEEKVTMTDAQFVQNPKKYIGVLKYVFQESPSISQRVENLRLNHESLINIAHDYHVEVCGDEECIVYEKKIPKIKNTFGILLGLNGMSISQTGGFSEDLYFMEDSQFGFNIYPSVGLFYKMNMPSINERLYFQCEILYSFVKLTTTNSYFDPTYKVDYLNNIALKLNSIDSRGVIKYEFPKGKVRPTFQIGGFAKYFFKTEYNRDLDITYTWIDSFLENQNYENPFSKFDYGIVCGIGVKSFYLSDKELFLDLKYQRGFGLLKNLSSNTISFDLGFQIGK